MCTLFFLLMKLNGDSIYISFSALNSDSMKMLKVKALSTKKSIEFKIMKRFVFFLVFVCSVHRMHAVNNGTNYSMILNCNHFFFIYIHYYFLIVRVWTVNHLAVGLFKSLFPFIIIIIRFVILRRSSVIRIL